MISFPEYKDCTLCPLHESAKNPGLPTRPYSVSGKQLALLVVGEAPGLNEDKQFKSWVGHAGTVLTRFLDASQLANYCDIYLTNTCRCHPPMNADPTGGEVSLCRLHLQSDLELLTREYKEVVILCCGKFGAQAVTKQSAVSSCFSMQGRPLSYFNVLKKGGLSPVGEYDPRVFFTFHPGALFATRQPHSVIAVADHFTLLLRYLSGKFTPNSIRVVPEFGVPVPTELPNIVCVDIETYGILKGVNQSVFHPMKSHHIDGVPIGKQIITVAFGYKDPQSPVGYRTCVYDFQKHRSIIRSWFSRLIQSGTTILGQNIKYDILYLRMNDPVLHELLNPQTTLLDDTLLVSFLFYEQRPEKGLKELATLFGLTDYRSLAVTGSSGTATGPRDPNLHYYNSLDTATTIALYDFTWSQIRDKYGENNPKFSDTCREQRNIVLWDTIYLEENGCAMSRARLLEVDREFRDKCSVAIEQAKEQGVLLQGTGSEASSRKFIESALKEMNLFNDKRVKFTEKKKEVSVGVDNFNLLIENSTPDSKYWIPLQAIKEYSGASKMVDSYTDKLLHVPAKGIVCGEMTYPTWYPTSGLGAKGSDTSGGTIQGRFACKNPGAQTYPSEIKTALVSRYLGGRVIGYDLSQIELRIAALLSGDPVMLEEYQKGIDRHFLQATIIWPELKREDEDYDVKRQAGKTLNFLVLYMGGAKKFQETLLKDMGLTLSLDRCQFIITVFDNKYRVFRVWQANCIAKVKQQGYLVLPTGWSRTWSTGDSVDNVVSEIADFPIQTISAQIIQSAQFEIQKELLRRRLYTKLVLQIHDAIYKDGPIEEEPEVESIIDRILPHPPLLCHLEGLLGRSVPILYEKEIF